jgi:hypothetical protein
VIKIFEAKSGLVLLGCRYPVNRGIFLQDKHVIGDIPAAFVIQNIIRLQQKI